MTKKPEFIDENPERDFANSERLGYILQISARQVRSLAASASLPRQPDGTFHINSAVDAFIAYKTAPRSRASEALNARRAEVIQRRLDREAKDLIGMTDALETFDIVTGAFMRAVDEVGDQTTRAFPGNASVAPAISNTKAVLADRFAKERHALKTGKWP